MKNYGFKQGKILPEEFKFGDGNFAGEIIRPDGQWIDDLPAWESQAQYFETMHCWVFGTLNCLETLIKAKYNIIDENYSERYIGVLGGATTSGGSPHNAAEAIRKYGNIDQSVLPWTPDLNSFWKYSAPRPASEMLRLYGAKGMEWLKDFSFGHDWIYWTGSYWARIKGFIAGLLGKDLGVSRIEAMKEALKYSPLGVSVYAWQYRNGKAYKNSWNSDNHWVECYGYKDGVSWLIYDHYDNKFVECEWAYPFGFVKRYSINKAGFDDATSQDIIDNYAQKCVKGISKNSIYYISNGKKRVFPDYVTYLAYCFELNMKPGQYVVVNQTALNNISEGAVMDIRSTVVWAEFLIDLKPPENRKKLEQLLNK